MITIPDDPAIERYGQLTSVTPTELPCLECGILNSVADLDYDQVCLVCNPH